MTEARELTPGPADASTGERNLGAWFDVALGDNARVDEEDGGDGSATFIACPVCEGEIAVSRLLDERECPNPDCNSRFSLAVRADEREAEIPTEGQR